MQSFFTEDHLSVHQATHGAKLNLEIPKGSNTIFGKPHSDVIGLVS